jgi:hypothetical protein
MLALVVGANAARRTVNVAARVEQLTKTTGDRISLSSTTPSTPWWLDLPDSPTGDRMR